MSLMSFISKKNKGKPSRFFERRNSGTLARMVK